MLILSYDPITTEIVIKRVDPTTINLVGAALSEHTLNGDLGVVGGYLTVENSLTVTDGSTLNLNNSSILEIV